MTKNEQTKFEVGVDWVYLKSQKDENPRTGYKIIQLLETDLGQKAQICSNGNVRLFELVSNLELITDPLIKFELDSYNQTDL
jgi:hypothetical protein